MRPFEVVIPVLLSLSLLWPPGARGSAVFAIIFVLIHLAIEKYRWQMVPLYVLSGILFLSGLPNWTGFRPVRTPGLILGEMVLPLILVAAAMALPWLMPGPPRTAPAILGT
jgi:hypothetical protein